MKISGERHYLGLAVDQYGERAGHPGPVPPDKAAVRVFFWKLLKKTQSVPRVVVADKLHSVRRRPQGDNGLGGAPAVAVPQQQSREQPPTDEAAGTRDEGFRSAGAAQRFLSALSGISPTSGPAATR
ncbi:hypothetical protein [Streptacidiphilus rugosus]|uniref:hypothetical protein n=1 Tax=Streptacidiphilus rugosus TaxID=405783 RepID=UPI0018DB3545|nr:hypothetical protein [Streptacidiphilus rugosus]